MLRKQKIQITFLITFFLVLPFPLIINIFYAKQLCSLRLLSYLFLIPCTLLLFTKPGKAIIGEEKQSKQHMAIWLLKILTIELCAFSLFAIQNQFLFTSLNTALSAHHMSWQQFISPSTLLYSCLAWAIVCFLGIVIAQHSHGRKTYTPFTFFLPRKTYRFIQNISHTIVEYLIKFATTVFLTLSSIFLLFQLAYIIHPSELYFVPINGMILATALAMFPRLTKIDELIQTIEGKNIRQGFHYLIIGVTFFAFLLLCVLATFLLSKSELSLMDFSFPRFFVNHVDLKTWIPLWHWGWWLLSAPLLGSILIAVSHGRSVRTFILAVLTLPLMLFIYTLLAHPTFLNHAFAIHIAQALSALFLLVLFVKKTSTTMLWTGFIPLHPIKKERRLHPMQMWLLWSSLTGLLLLTSFIGIQLLVIGLVLVLLVIYLLQLSTSLKAMFVK
ncbi:MAG: BCCT family transporter [Gammaproteobacteria bacterium]|nr:BCCT family transporter [Gammaproteobacteria bacterium]MBU2546412.1 BCCT family transporter [Gammaproteobacteria bacterium]